MEKYYIENFLEHMQHYEVIWKINECNLLIIKRK